MTRPKGLKIDVEGSPEASGYRDIPEDAHRGFTDAQGARQAHPDNPLNFGVERTNVIPLRDDIDTEVGQQRPVLDEIHPHEFITNTRTRGGSDPTRD